MNQEPPDSGSYDHRFSGIRRLYGNAKIPTLQQAHFTIVGVGGVGSWAAESLARSGIGTLTLIDWDDMVKCVILGASLCGLARPFLQPGLESVDAVRAVIQRLKREYITALFLLGVESTEALIGREELIRDEDRD